MQHRIHLCLLFMATIASSQGAANADESVALRWKWVPDSEFQYAQETSVQGESTLGAAPSNADTRSLRVRYRILEVDTAGTARILAAPVALRVDGPSAGGELTTIVDSEAPERTHSDAQAFLRRFLAGSYSFRVDACGNVLSEDGWTKFVLQSSGADVNAEDAQTMSAAIDVAGANGRRLESFLIPLPESPVRVGDTWTRETRETGSSDANRSVVHRYTLESIETVDGVRCARIGWTAAFSTDQNAPPLPAPSGGSGFEERMVMTGEGTVSFSLEQGFALRAIGEYRVVNELVSVGGGGPSGEPDRFVGHMKIVTTRLRPESQPK